MTKQRIRRVGVGIVATVVLASAIFPVLALTAPEATPGAAEVAHVNAGTSWTVYHGDPLGSGTDTSGASFSSELSALWTTPALDGQLYGEPLEAAGRVFVATENDTVYALAANSGQILWYIPCGHRSARRRSPVR